MRIIEKRRGFFHATHKGAEIVIEREKDFALIGRPFYITVTARDGGRLYDGYAPTTVTTMKDAKREALKGAWPP